MIRLTDKTLTVIDTTGCNTGTLVEFYRLLLQMGADIVEMDRATAERLDSVLVEERTVVRQDDHMQGTLVSSLMGFHEVQVNDLSELGLLERYQGSGNIRITGLSDLMLHDFQKAFQKIRTLMPQPIELCPANNYGCAGAILTEWLMDGGSGVGTFMGVGGFAPLEEVIMALHVTRQYRPNLDLSMLPRLCQLFTEISGIPVPAHKAVAGHAVFDVESGIHVDGILKDAMNYEPFSPDVVGSRRRIVIGKHSGLGSLKYCLADLGYELPVKAFPKLLDEVRREAVRLKSALTDGEVLALAEKVRLGNETKSISHGYYAS